MEETLKKTAEANEEAAKAKSKKSSKPTGTWTGRIHADYWGYSNQSEGIDNFEHPRR